MTAPEPTPALLALADIIAAVKGTTTSGELNAARGLLAAHARELAEFVQQRINQDRADNPSGAYPKHRRGGMAAARSLLDQYADDLDAAGGGV